MKRIYLDNNATTPLHPEVKKVLVDAMEVYGNPSSLHSYGREARQLVEDAREKAAKFIGAHTDDIVFTGSGSEANNTVLTTFTCQSRFCSLTAKHNAQIITTKIEHPCVLETASCLAGKGIKVAYLDVDQYGKINLEELKNSITEDTGLVSIMTANNEIGTIQDIKEISKIARSKGVLIHTDAVQAVGKIPINVNDLDVDYLTFSGHKIYGPKGTGVMYIKKGSPFCPFIRGGHQEKGRRAGTENTLGIIGTGKAIEMRVLEMEKDEKKFVEFKKLLKKGIEDNIPDIKFNGHPTDCLSNTLNVSFFGAEGEAILLYLDLEGVAVSTGSACASGSLDPSHVLLATGLSAENAHGSIRISMGRETTTDEIERVLDILPKVIKKIRDMSTAYVNKK